MFLGVRWVIPRELSTLGSSLAVLLLHVCGCNCPYTSDPRVESFHWSDPPISREHTDSVINQVEKYVHLSRPQWLGESYYALFDNVNGTM